MDVYPESREYLFRPSHKFDSTIFLSLMRRVAVKDKCKLSKIDLRSFYLSEFLPHKLVFCQKYFNRRGWGRGILSSDVSQHACSCGMLFSDQEFRSVLINSLPFSTLPEAERHPRQLTQHLLRYLSQQGLDQNNFLFEQCCETARESIFFHRLLFQVAPRRC